MRGNKQHEKIQAKYTLLWCLKIGAFLGTFNQHNLIKEFNLKPIFVRRWVLGKLVVPQTLLYQVKHLAYAPPRSQKFRKVRAPFSDQSCLVSLEARSEWKLRFFDEMNSRAKYKFCKRLKHLL
ncbi:hypothetical protein [Methylophilus sp. 3sh_L]|uniref:hypothetical protein n=1 Tax=Methylophilus sp. 3sh_L TaxID=3377114 RepID=UPI00398F5A5C